MSKSLFVNLPVANLEASTKFYEALGLVRNKYFSNGQASSMVWSDTITLQLLTREYFSTFSPKPVADAHRSCQVLLALTRDSRTEVDSLVNTAASNGGKADERSLVDLGWLYNRSFADPDGHLFEAVWLDMQAMESVQVKK